MRLVYAALWMGVIFATSCTVVNRPAFVSAVGHVLPGEITREAWARFWYAWGLFVVKGYHAAEFGLLFVLVWSALRGLGPRRGTWAAMLVCIGFAASDEWHQTFVQGRGGTVGDVVIDSLGIVAAALWTGHRRTGRGEDSSERTP